MRRFSKTTLLVILLIVSVIATGTFSFQWWQVKGGLGKQIEQNENLAKQVNELQAEIDELQKEIEGLKIIANYTREVVLTTDKKEYSQGEIIKVSLRNNSDKSILYLDPKIGPCGSGPYWWGLQKFEKDSWQELRIIRPGGIKKTECRICLREYTPIEMFVREAQAGSEMFDNWNLKNCKGTTLSFIGSGNYRLTFTYGLSKDSWEEKIVYSNEFTIK